MKHILILTSDSGKTVAWKEREQYVLEFARHVESQVPDTTVSLAVYGDMYYSVIDGTPVIYDSRNGRDMREYAFVHFKNWQYEHEDASIVAGHLHRHGVEFANEEVNSGLHFNKLSQMFTLSAAGVPVPNTVYGYPVSKKFRTFLFQHISFPMIVKANDGSRGDSNYLVHNEAELDEILQREPEKHFIFQDFIPNKGDYRILFIGSQEDPLVFLRQSDGTSHLNNTSKGGSGTHVKFQDLSLAIQRDARTAVKALRREISGVDVMINHKTGKHYMLEVNSTPALATGFALEEKMKAFCTFLNDLTEEKEEE